jgi:hypothetical protein
LIETSQGSVSQVVFLLELSSRFGLILDSIDDGIKPRKNMLFGLIAGGELRVSESQLQVLDPDLP